MKKDIEWLKEEIQKLPVKYYGFSILKHKDEYMVDEDEVLKLINQLDEPETLSQEWIDEHTKRKFFDFDEERTEVVFVDDLQNLLVPKQELPVIPKVVADWYESEGKCSSWWNWFYKWGRDESRTELETKTIRWMQDYNEEKFVDMFRYGYTVEEEQKYYIMDKNYKLLLYQFRYEEDKQPIAVVGHYTIEEVKLQNEETPEITLTDYQFTEQEIKDYDERFWPFAVKVEELE